MSASDPKSRGAGESPELAQAGSEPLFPPQLRAALRRELGPDAADRERVRAALWSSVSAGTLSPTAQRVDASLSGHGAGAIGSKGAVTTTGHALSTKLVLAGVLLAGGATAVVLRGPTTVQPRAAVEVPISAVIPSAPVAARTAGVEAPSNAVIPSAPVPAVGAANQAEPAQVAPASADPVGSPLTAARPEALAERRRSPKTKLPNHAAAAPEVTVSTRGEAAANMPGAAPTNDSVQARSAPTSAADTERSIAASAAQQAQPEPVAAPTPAPKHALAAELALVRAASDALQRGDTQEALVQLQRHATRFPNGALAVEVEALRAIALCSAGSISSAAVSGRFLKQHAGSPLAERVRRACREGSQR